jgi:hypothetical protein
MCTVWLVDSCSDRFSALHSSSRSRLATCCTVRPLLTGLHRGPCCVRHASPQQCFSHCMHATGLAVTASAHDSDRNASALARLRRPCASVAGRTTCLVSGHVYSRVLLSCRRLAAMLASQRDAFMHSEIPRERPVSRMLSSPCSHFRNARSFPATDSSATFRS